MRETVKKNIIFYGVTVLLIGMIVMCCSITAMSKNDITAKEKQAFYMEKEQNMLRETREYLNQKGYRNSGVSVTRVVNDNGCRDYTITIHHSKINELEDSEKLLLVNELEGFTFEDEDCTFCHEFLVNN